MGPTLFFLFVVMAGLLWTAACTAAAGRTTRPGARATLATLGMGGPVLAVMPVVAATWWLAFVMHMETNWFPQAITATIALVVGGICIVRGGLTTDDGAGAPAARWPLIGLAALFVIAKAVTVGVLLILDNAVAAQAAYLRLEAAHLMESNLPPIVADDENAATLHLQAGATIAADASLEAENSPLADEGDIMRPEVAEVLARHADTIDVIRRAADRETCRFVRDWSLPSIDMLLPEIQTLRSEARLLSLAARREAAEGRGDQALADVVRIQRLGLQASAEPLLVSHLVGLAIDQHALATLIRLLPTLGPADRAALESDALRDLLGRRLRLIKALYGEEAWGLTSFAGFADGRLPGDDLIPGGGVRDLSSRSFFDIGPLFRVFFLPADLAGYRRIMHQYQQLASQERTLDFAEVKRVSSDIEQAIVTRPPGVLSRLIVPSISAVFRSQCRDEAMHRAAAVLVAATRQRLMEGATPESIDDLVPSWLPVALPDPFGTGVPMRMKRSDGGLSVYSVGPNGKDDGGPGHDDREASDDIGFVMVGAPEKASPRK